MFAAFLLLRSDGWSGPLQLKALSLQFCVFLFWLQTLIAFALSPEERGTERGKEEGEEGCREEGEEEKQSQRKSQSSVTPYIRLAFASRVVGLKHALPHPFLGCWFVLVFCFMYMFGFCWYHLYFIFTDMVSSLETCNVVKNALKLLILLHLHPLAWVTHIHSLSSLVLFCNLFSTFDSPVIIKNPNLVRMGLTCKSLDTFLLYFFLLYFVCSTWTVIFSPYQYESWGLFNK